MRLLSVPHISPRALTSASLASLLPPNPCSPRYKQRLCQLHTSPVPRREIVHSQSSCTMHERLPVLTRSQECNFTTTVDTRWHDFL